MYLILEAINYYYYISESHIIKFIFFFTDLSHIFFYRCCTNIVHSSIFQISSQSSYHVLSPLQIQFHRSSSKIHQPENLQVVTKEENQYTFDSSLIMRNVTVEDAGKYKVTAR